MSRGNSTHPARADKPHVVSVRPVLTALPAFDSDTGPRLLAGRAVVAEPFCGLSPSMMWSSCAAAGCAADLTMEDRAARSSGNGWNASHATAAKKTRDDRTTTHTTRAGDAMSKQTKQGTSRTITSFAPCARRACSETPSSCASAHRPPFRPRKQSDGRPGCLV